MRTPVCFMFVCHRRSVFAAVSRSVAIHCGVCRSGGDKRQYISCRCAVDTGSGVEANKPLWTSVAGPSKSEGPPFTLVPKYRSALPGNQSTISLAHTKFVRPALHVCCCFLVFPIPLHAPEGPWQQLAATLMDNGGLFLHDLPVPNHYGST